MKIQCTKKVLDELHKTAESELPGEDPFFSWHCQMISLNRRKMLLIVNDLTRLCVVFYGLKAAHHKTLDAILRDGILRVMINEGVDSETAAEYAAACGEVHYAKSGGREYIGKLNRLVMELPYVISEEDMMPEMLLQLEASMRLNDRLALGMDKKYIVPHDEMHRILGVRNGSGTGNDDRNESEDAREITNETKNAAGREAKDEINNGNKVIKMPERNTVNLSASEEEFVEPDPFGQKKLTFLNRKGKHFTFNIHRFDLPGLISFQADEVRRDKQPGRRVEIMSKQPCQEHVLFQAFCKKISRYVDRTYIKKETDRLGNKRLALVADELAGYLEWSDANEGRINDVVIDGKTYTWEEIGRMLASYEGFQIQIKLLDRTEDITSGRE